MTNIAQTARAFADAFEKKQRDNGEDFYILDKAAPEWMFDAVFSSHSEGDRLPNDWSYIFAQRVAEDIAIHLEGGDDVEDMRPTIVDSICPIYNSERAEWLASDVSRGAYCDQAQEDGMVSPDADIWQRIAVGICAEIEEIFGAIWGAIQSQSK